jgi:hypothetical protein
MHLFLKLFILVKHSTCFGWSFRPSSRAQDCTYSNRYMSNSCCSLLLAGMRWRFNLVPASSSCLTYTCCCMCSLELLMMDRKTIRNMYSVLQEYIISETGASCSFYYRNILQCMDLSTSNWSNCPPTQSMHARTRVITNGRTISKVDGGCDKFDSHEKCISDVSYAHVALITLQFLSVPTDKIKNLQDRGQHVDGLYVENRVCAYTDTSRVCTYTDTSCVCTHTDTNFFCISMSRTQSRSSFKHFRYPAQAITVSTCIYMYEEQSHSRLKQVRIHYWMSVR